MPLPPRETKTLPYVTLLRLECADQSDDLRRQGQLPVCHDGARAFCGHAGSLADLGQLGLKKKISYKSESNPDAVDATTETSKPPEYRMQDYDSIYDCT